MSRSHEQKPRYSAHCRICDYAKPEQVARLAAKHVAHDVDVAIDEYIGCYWRYDCDGDDWTEEYPADCEHCSWDAGFGRPIEHPPVTGDGWALAGHPPLDDHH